MRSSIAPGVNLIRRHKRPAILQPCHARQAYMLGQHLAAGGCCCQLVTGHCATPMGQPHQLKQARACCCVDAAARTLAAHTACLMGWLCSTATQVDSLHWRYEPEPGCQPAKCCMMAPIIPRCTLCPVPSWRHGEAASALGMLQA